MSTNENESYETLLFGDKKSRWYQVAAKNGVEDALDEGVMRILIVHPTGAGKTVTSGLVFSSDRVRRALNVPATRKLRLLFITHKERLLTQAERAYADASNIEFIPHSAFQDIPANLDWDIACIDEAHHEAMLTIQYQLDKLGDKPIIGLTATPDRADGMLIKFERIIEPITREEAVAQGYLAKTYINSILDAPSKFKIDVTKRIINEFGPEFGQTMMFFRTQYEVREINDYLLSLGYKSIAVLGQTGKQLDVILDDFSAGKHQFVVNCNRINEGVDVVGCSDVYLGRQFGSYPQLNQVIGRASRPDSKCIVWELINPISKNLDTTVVVGTPQRHRLISKRGNNWHQQKFDYTSTRTDEMWNGKRSAASTGGMI
jgi:superfamily II DNA or RNA helicase